MRLVTYRGSITDEARLGALVDEYVIDVRRLAASNNEDLPKCMLEFIDLGPTALQSLKQLLASGDERGWPVGVALPAVNVRLLAPIPKPRKNIFGIGLNYVEHVAESSRSLNTAKDLPKQPVIFSKPPTTVIGPGDPIEHNARITKQLDWEVELAAIIDRRAKAVPLEAALDYVFGYRIMIDVSARDYRRAGQWIYSKGQDTYAPFRPCIVTADEIPDPQCLGLWLSVNGETKQRSNTCHMLFKVADLVSDISAGITLEPGDIIATGTPDGVDAGCTPQEWLWPGDVVVAGVEGIGEIRHSVVAV